MVVVGVGLAKSRWFSVQKTPFTLEKSANEGVLIVLQRLHDFGEMWQEKMEH